MGKLRVHSGLVIILAAFLALGALYEIRADPGAAEDSYREALEVAPADEKGYLALGRLEETQGDRKAAKALYRRAIAVAPGSAKGRLHLARLYALEGRRAQALAELEAASKVAPASASVLVALGDGHREQSDWELAEKAYQRNQQAAAESPESNVHGGPWSGAQGGGGDVIDAEYEETGS